MNQFPEKNCVIGAVIGSMYKRVANWSELVGILLVDRAVGIMVSVTIWVCGTVCIDVARL